MANKEYGTVKASSLKGVPGVTTRKELDEILNAPTKKITSKPAVSATAQEIVKSLGLEDYRYGQSPTGFQVIPPSRESRKFHIERAYSTIDPKRSVGYEPPSFLQKTIGATTWSPKALSGPRKAVSEIGKGAFNLGLAVLTIGVSSIVGAVETIGMSVNRFLTGKYASDPIKQARMVRERQEIKEAGFFKGLPTYLGHLMDRRSGEEGQGVHKGYYGVGDVFNTFGFLQGDDPVQWTANRGLALVGDFYADPLNRFRVVGNIAKRITGGLKTGKGMQMAAEKLRAKIMQQATRQGKTKEMADFFAKNPTFTRNYLKTQEQRAHTGQKFITNFTQSGVRISLDDKFANDLARIVKLSGVYNNRPFLTSLTNDDYRFLARQMVARGMDDNFLVKGMDGFKGAMTRAEAATAGLGTGIVKPFTGWLPRKFRNATRASGRLLKLTNKQGLDGPVLIPLTKKGFDGATGNAARLALLKAGKLIRFPAGGKLSGITRKALRRGTPYGGRFSEKGSLKEIIRTPYGETVQIDDVTKVVANHSTKSEAREAIHAVSRGAAQGRVAQQEFKRHLKEFLADLQSNGFPNDGESGQLVARAMGGDPEAFNIIRQKMINAGASPEAIEQFADRIRGFMPFVRVLANNRAGMNFLAQQANYRPRPLSDQAREFLQSIRPSQVHRRHRTPYSPEGFEKQRKWIDKEEFEKLVQEKMAKGMSREAAENAVAESGRLSNMMGYDLYKPGSKMADGRIAKDVETQIAEIMSTMGLDYGLFSDNVYEFLPRYMDGIATRVGEVYTERLLRDTGMFVDRIVRLQTNPNRDIQKAWRNVRAMSSKLTHMRGGIEDLIDEIAFADKTRIKKLRSTLQKRKVLLDMAEKRHNALVNDLNTKIADAEAAEAKVVQFEQEIAGFQEDLANLTFEYSLRQQKRKGQLSLKEASDLATKRQKILKKINQLQGDPSVAEFQLQRLRAATVALIDLETVIVREFGSQDTFEFMGRFIRRSMEFFPEETAKVHFGEGMSPEVVYDLVQKWIRRIAETPNMPKKVAVFAEMFDLMPERGLFNVTLPDGQVINQDQFEVLTRAGLNVMEELDASELSSWYSVQTYARPFDANEVISDEFDRYDTLDEILDILTDIYDQPRALEYVDLNEYREELIDAGMTEALAERLGFDFETGIIPFWDAESGVLQLPDGEVYSGDELRRLMNSTNNEASLLLIDVIDDIKGMRALHENEASKSEKFLADFLAVDGEKFFEGNIPTPDEVLAAKQLIVDTYESRSWLLDKHSRGYDPFEEITPELQQAINTYYGTYGLLEGIMPENMGAVDNVMAQLEDVLQNKQQEITDALSEFREVKIEIIPPGSSRSETVKLGLDEYAHYRWLQSQAKQTPETIAQPFNIKKLSIDDIKSGGVLEKGTTGPEDWADNAQELMNEGIMPARNLGGRYRVDTLEGPKFFYVKTYGVDRFGIDRGAGLEQNLHASRDVMANALYREMGFTAPVSYASFSTAENRWYVVSEWLPDLQYLPDAGQIPAMGLDELGVHAAEGAVVYFEGGGLPRILTEGQLLDLPVSEQNNVVPISRLLGDGFLLDVFLGNFDLPGAQLGNVAMDQAGRLVRLDNGEAFQMLRQGDEVIPFDSLNIFEQFAKGEIDTGMGYMSVRNAMLKRWYDNLQDEGHGFTAEMLAQFEKMDALRVNYGDWRSFAKRHLPDADDETIDFYVGYLEERFDDIAKIFNRPVTKGTDAIRQAAQERGIQPSLIDEVLGQTNPKLQTTSKKLGYEPWLNPHLDDEEPVSQAIDRFNVLDGSAEEAVEGKLDGLLLKEFKQWLKSYTTGDPRAIEDSVSYTGNPYTAGIWDEIAEGQTVEYGMLVVDDNGDILLRLPVDDNGKSPKGMWTLATDMGDDDYPLESALLAFYEQTGLEAEAIGTLPKTYYVPSATEADESIRRQYFIGRLRPGQVAGTKKTVIPAEVTETVEQVATSTPTQLTGDKEVLDNVMTLFHTASHGDALAASDVLSFNNVGWSDHFGINAHTPPVIVNNRLGVDVHAIDVDVGLSGERIKVYGQPIHAHQGLVQAARQQTMGAVGDYPTLTAAQMEIDRLTSRGTVTSYDTEDVGRYLPQQAVISSMDQYAVDMQLDQLERVYNFNPTLFEEILVNLKTNKSGIWGPRRKEVNSIFAIFGELDARLSYSSTWKNLSFREKLTFIGYLHEEQGWVRRLQFADYGRADRAYAANMPGWEAPISMPDYDNYATWVLQKNLTPEGFLRDDVGVNEMLDSALNQYLAYIDPTKNATAWGNKMAFELSAPIAAIRDILTEAQQRVTLLRMESELWDKKIAEPFSNTINNFVRTYRDSLSVDGYSAIMYMSDESFQTGFSVNALNASYGKNFANFVLINPTAMKATPRITGTPEWLMEGGDIAFEEARKATPVDVDSALEMFEEAWNKSILAPKQIAIEAPWRRDGLVPVQDVFEAYTDAISASAKSLNQPGGARDQLANAQREVKKAKKLVREGAKETKFQQEGIEQLDREVDALVAKADRALEILEPLVNDEFGRGIPLNELPEQVAELKIAVGILMESDTEKIKMALELLEEGADSAKYLRNVGALGDDDLFFPLKRTEAAEKYAEVAWESGYRSIGVNSQGPEHIVASMIKVEEFKARGGWSKFWNFYDKVHNLTKGYMIMKPGFHMRNFYSAVFMNYLDDVKLESYRQFQRAFWVYQYDQAVAQGLTRRAKNLKAAFATHGIRKGNVSKEHVEIIALLDRNGLLGGAQGQIGVEFAPVAGPAKGKMGKALQAINPISSRNAPLRLSRNAGVGVETYVRGTMAFDSVKRGDSIDMAFDRVMKFHFDYSDLAEWEKKLKRVLPFYVWTRKNMPLMFEQMLRRPGKFNAYNIAKNNIQATEDDDAPVPDWMVRGGAIRLPMKYQGEHMWILPDLPFKTPMEWLNPVLSTGSVEERIRSALSTAGSMVTPLMKAPVEAFFKTNIWKGYSFNGKFQQVPTIYQKIPLLMPMLQLANMAEKNKDGVWLMRDYNLHAMGTMLVPFSDMRRLYPSEEKYQERLLSTWMSFLFGLGLRTNTKWEQERTLEGLQAAQKAEDREQQRRKKAGLEP